MSKEVKESEMVNAYDFLDEKRFKVGKILFYLVLWIIIIVLLLTWICDFINVYNHKKPVFCLNNKTYEYKTGTIKECTGLGYKVYTYNRVDKKEKYEFVPMFIKKNKNYMK